MAMNKIEESDKDLEVPRDYEEGVMGAIDADGHGHAPPRRVLASVIGNSWEEQKREQAVIRIAKADPKNIQEVAASQLAIINSYYQSGLQQSQQSFRWSLIWGGIGFGFLIVAVSMLLLGKPTNVAFASGIAGALVEVFAGTYLYLYKHASDQLASFRASLESTQRVLLANSMCEKLEGEREQITRAELIHLVVSSAVDSQRSKVLEKATTAQP
jgi:hypothetical protein